MIISNEQIQLCLDDLRVRRPRGSAVAATVTPEQLSKIKAYLQRVPDVREPVVARLKQGLHGYDRDGLEIAEKMLGRLISDMVR